MALKEEQSYIAEEGRKIKEIIQIPQGTPIAAVPFEFIAMPLDAMREKTGQTLEAFLGEFPWEPDPDRPGINRHYGEEIEVPEQYTFFGDLETAKMQYTLSEEHSRDAFRKRMGLQFPEGHPEMLQAFNRSLPLLTNIDGHTFYNIGSEHELLESDDLVVGLNARALEYYSAHGQLLRIHGQNSWQLDSHMELARYGSTSQHYRGIAAICRDNRKLGETLNVFGTTIVSESLKDAGQSNKAQYALSLSATSKHFFSGS